MASAAPPSLKEVRWHVPGPSSRYHKRAYDQSTPKSGRLTPLSTPEPEPYRVQFTTSPKHSSRYSSFTTNDRTYLLARRHTAPDMHDDPHTPVGSPQQAAASIHRGSPFSDYFTDDGHSIVNKAGHSLQSPEAQHIVLRLNNLGAHVLRQQLSSYTFDAITTQLDKLENAIGWTEHRTNRGLGLHDSGFVDDFPDIDVDKEPLAVKSPSASIKSSEHDDTPKQATKKKQVASSHDKDYLRANAQKILERVTQANAELRRRFDEVTEMSDQTSSQLEEANQKILHLQSENETLKANLGFDHTELLYIKLQLKSLELQLDELGSDGQMSKAQQEQKLRLEKDMEQYKSLWDDIDTRFRNRREHHRVVSVSMPPEVERLREDGRATGDEGDWKLDVTRKRVGRVHSITLSRTLSSDVVAETTEEEATTDENAKAVNDIEAAVQPEERPDLSKKLSTMSVVTVFSDSGVADSTAKKPQQSVHFSEVDTFHELKEADGNANEDEEEGPEAAKGSGEQDMDEPATRRMTAWQELMQSLSEFAGMTIYD